MINKKMYHSAFIASLLLAPTLSAAERDVVATVKSELPQLTQVIQDQQDRILIQDFILDNYHVLTPSTIDKLESLVGTPVLGDDTGFSVAK